MSRLQNHLSELEIALDGTNDNRIMPEFRESDTAVLDIGCGIQQNLLAASLDPKVFPCGIDIDIESMQYGLKRGAAKFVKAGGDRLLFASGTFALVIDRVSLPYTNLPNAIKEIRRVLNDNGRVWMTLHSFERETNHLWHSLKKAYVKDVVFR